MKGEWCYFRQYLSNDDCNEIIQNALTIEPQQAVLGVNGTELDVNLNYRRSQVRFISDKDWRFTKLFDVLWKTAIVANKDFFNIHITKLDYVQFAEYDESYAGEYKEHHDVFWMNGDPTYHRKLSAIIQLTDPEEYDGCDLEMTEAGHKPPPEEIREQGSIIYFPSFMRHRATPIIRGKRYSIAAWFDGPRWR
jgi:predicted 2-oxoglutarate/Fe(II)-dependent dioxygenase YbiX